MGWNTGFSHVTDLEKPLKKKRCIREYANTQGGGDPQASAHTSLGFFCMLQTHLFGFRKPKN